MNKEQDQPQAYGVFKPVGHVVISFEPEADLDVPQKALLQSGVEERDIKRYTAEQMKEVAQQSIEHATPLASLGQELNLAKAQRALAEQGYGWLVVKVDNDEQAQRVADIAKPLKAERAQYYGRFIIEELIEYGDDLPQVAESPARGLDTQTVSGHQKV